MAYELEKKAGKPHVACPKTGYAGWFLRPAGVLCELGIQKLVTGDTARFVRDTLHPELVKRGGDGPYLIGLNWTGMVGYDAEARDVFVEIGRKNKHVYRDTTVCIPDVHPVARIGIESAAAILTVAGVRINVVDTLDDLLEAVPLQLDYR